MKNEYLHAEKLLTLAFRHPFTECTCVRNESFFYGQEIEKFQFEGIIKEASMS